MQCTDESGRCACSRTEQARLPGIDCRRWRQRKAPSVRACLLPASAVRSWLPRPNAAASRPAARHASMLLLLLATDAPLLKLHALPTSLPTTALPGGPGFCIHSGRCSRSGTGGPPGWAPAAARAGCVAWAPEQLKRGLRRSGGRPLAWSASDQVGQHAGGSAQRAAGVSGGHRLPPGQALRMAAHDIMHQGMHATVP